MSRSFDRIELPCCKTYINRISSPIIIHIRTGILALFLELKVECLQPTFILHVESQYHR